MDLPDIRVRLDKWLWAARFFKTRSLAAEAVSGGKVHVNGERAKPSRALHPGDALVIRRGLDEYTVLVKALSERRGPAREAALLYEETETSRLRREEEAARRRAMAAAAPQPPPGRPSKRDRRHIIRFIKKDSS